MILVRKQAVASLIAILIVIVEGFWKSGTWYLHNIILMARNTLSSQKRISTPAWVLKE